MYMANIIISDVKKCLQLPVLSFPRKPGQNDSECKRLLMLDIQSNQDYVPLIGRCLISRNKKCQDRNTTLEVAVKRETINEILCAKLKACEPHSAQLGSFHGTIGIGE